MQIDLVTISSLVGMISIVFGILVSLHSIRRYTKARQLSIFLEFNKTLYDEDFIKDMNEIQTWKWKGAEEFFVKYGPEPNPDAFAKYIKVVSYFDGLSTLVQRKFMDKDFIPETTAISLIQFWEKFAPTADALGMVYRRPQCWDSIKHLYAKLQKTDYRYDRESYEKHLERQSS